ncbi:tyrosine-type recombinase/integrase [Desulfosporosinus sp. Sb-LF]|uniref:tyrosine-type recombinase/integrase n=1 Tax=Desulfosporosinus sp. Sb-LF TaxID=2560027 RepID=UPI00107EF349|nr:tyrosine-type recombinase/integrase [Desulfosporosinus sp. Sb-LF]TGE32857.1 hypothetical protein E4K68_08385 [Desulfosporosinus sp. Sb-LF]
MEQFIDNIRAQGKSELTVRQYKSSIKRFCEWMSANSSDTPQHPPTPFEAPKLEHKINIQFFESIGTQSNPNATPSDPLENLTFIVRQATQKDVANYKRFATANWKPNTARQRLTQLRAYLEFLVDRGEIIDNPCKHVDPVIVGTLAPKWLNSQEQNTLIRFVRKFGDLREYTIITLLLHTGLRVQELCDLRMNDIELTERKGKLIVRKGKWNRYREIPLNVDCRRILTQYIAEHNPTEFLFGSQRSAALSTRGVQHIFTKYQQFTGIDDLTAHTLRHTFCHELVGRKVPLDVVARLAGHMKKDGSPNIQQTLIYTAPSEEDLARAVEELSWV